MNESAASAFANGNVAVVLKGQTKVVKLSKIDQKKLEYEKEQMEMQLEIERMQMTAEDDLSMKAEIFN